MGRPAKNTPDFSGYNDEAILRRLTDAAPLTDTEYKALQKRIPRMHKGYEEAMRLLMHKGTGGHPVDTDVF